MSLQSNPAKLYELVRAKLEADVPELLFIDLDTGQLDQVPGMMPDIPFPCALINIDDINYVQLQGFMHADVTFSIKLGVDPFSGTSNITPEYVREKGLSIFEIEKKVQDALHHWEANGLFVKESRKRKSSAEKNRADKLKVRMPSFAGTWTEPDA